jgi:dihydropteroate synthase
MGVVNVSPESFYRGSVHVDLDALTRAVIGMVEGGAALIDVGARSSAPYLPTAISETEECDRLSRAVEHLVREVPVPIAADTAALAPARAALDAGARVVNDVSGLSDAGLARLVAEREAGLILMASPPADALAARADALSASSPIATVKERLSQGLERAQRAGVLEERIVIDPGIGFFRRGPITWDEWDVQILGHLAVLLDLGRPLCVGVSRKSFIGAITGRTSPAERLAGSLAATVAAVWNGAALIRAHDVPETVDAIRVAARVRRAMAA